MTTAELACCRRGVTLSMIPSASRPSAGMYLASESKMNTFVFPGTARETRTRKQGRRQQRHGYHNKIGSALCSPTEGSKLRQPRVATNT